MSNSVYDFGAVQKYLKRIDDNIKNAIGEKEEGTAKLLGFKGLKLMNVVVQDSSKEVCSTLSQVVFDLYCAIFDGGEYYQYVIVSDRKGYWRSKEEAEQIPVPDIEFSFVVVKDKDVYCFSRDTYEYEVILKCDTEEAAKYAIEADRTDDQHIKQDGIVLPNTHYYVLNSKALGRQYQKGDKLSEKDKEVFCTPETRYSLSGSEARAWIAEIGVPRNAIISPNRVKEWFES